MSSFWPQAQLLITADNSKRRDLILHPTHQLRFLQSMARFASPTFAQSLVYSTSEDNTGWTAFEMGTLGHVTFHHWDSASPSLLQLDVFGVRTEASAEALDIITEFWKPDGMRAILIRRSHPCEDLDIVCLQNSAAVRHSGDAGLGPGDHLHILADDTSSVTGYPDAADLDRALITLVSQINMRCMTPVISNVTREQDGFQYDAIVGITTSHVSLRIRIRDHVQSTALDLFSCRHFEPILANNWLNSITGKSNIRRTILYNRYPHGTFSVL